MSTLDVDEIKIPKWLAVEDARKRNIQNESLWNQTQHNLADQLFVMVSQVYSSRVFKNYREKFIAVKAETPRVSNYNLLGKLEEFCDANKIERVRTRNSVVYRLK
jgi:hypothetical protein